MSKTVGAGTSPAKATAGAGKNPADKKKNKKQVLVNVDLLQEYPAGTTADKIVLSNLEQVIYNYFVEKFQQENYRNTLNEFQANITKLCEKAGMTYEKNKSVYISADCVFIPPKSIKKPLLKIHLENIDRKAGKTLKSNVSSNGNCIIKLEKFDADYIKEKQTKTLTEKQEQAKKERQAKKEKLDKIAEFSIDNNGVKAGKVAIDNVMELVDDDKKNELRISLLEQEFNNQDNKAIKTSLLNDDGKFNCAFLVLKSCEYARLLKIEKDFHSLKKSAGKKAGPTAENPAKTTAEIPTETK